ncbi:MAG: hypothetical protein IT379_40035 [Deltaproteobacteria bacterium]|nr:hypothetical protein [Deltaproteobacteria bacterium]
MRGQLCAIANVVAQRHGVTPIHGPREIHITVGGGAVALDTEDGTIKVIASAHDSVDWLGIAACASDLHRRVSDFLGWLGGGR